MSVSTFHQSVFMSWSQVASRSNSTPQSEGIRWRYGLSHMHVNANEGKRDSKMADQRQWNKRNARNMNANNIIAVGILYKAICGVRSARVM